jgi:PAS domain-containing protein
MLGQLTRIMNLPEDRIINHPSLLINVLDHQHRILFWNKKCEEFFDIKEEQALGNLLEVLIPNIYDNPKMVRLNEALSGKQVFITDDKYDNKNYYTQIVLPLKNQKGEVVAAVNIVRFIHCEEPTLNSEPGKNSCITIGG